MTDIVGRLRRWRREMNNTLPGQLLTDADEAADEIERLRAELEEFTELKEYAKSLGQETYLHLHAKNERLRAALEEIAATAEADAYEVSWYRNRARQALTPDE